MTQRGPRVLPVLTRPTRPKPLTQPDTMIHYQSDPHPSPRRPSGLQRDALLLLMSDAQADKLPLAAWRERERLKAAGKALTERLEVVPRPDPEPL